MPDFALVIDQSTAHLYQLGRSDAVRIATAAAHDSPLDWVMQHLPASATCAMVSDLMEESYTRSVLPPIWLPATRQQLIQRRLVQQLRDQRYRAAVVVPSGSWRPPTRISLIGVGHSEKIDQWVAALVARQVHIKGLWPLSALIALAVNPKAARRTQASTATAAGEPASTRATLALVSTPAGLRQVLVRGKTPLFSRLVLPSQDNSLSTAYVLSEARRTVQYLISQEWLTTADQPVATQMWLAFEDAPDLLDVRSDKVLDVQSLNPITDAYAHLLPLLRAAPAQPQFLAENYRQSWRVAQFARASQLLGGVLLAVAVLWSGESLWRSYDKHQLGQRQIARAAVLNQQAQQEIQRAKGDLSQAGLAVATVLAWKQTIAAQPSQLEALQGLATALRNAPPVELQKIRWQLPRLAQDTSGVGAAVAAAAPVAALACSRLNDTTASITPSANAPAGTSQASKPPAALIELTMALAPNLSQRQALQLQQDMRDALNTNLNAIGWQTYISKPSVNLDSAQAQTGKLGESVNRTLELCLEKAAP